MEIRNCRSCNRLFQHIGGPAICPNCKDALEKKFTVVKEYIRDNPRVSVKQVAEETEVSIKQIKQWIREDRLVLSEPDADGITCEKCGTPICSGRFCAKCKTKMADKLTATIARPKPTEDSDKKGTNEGNKMRFLS